jgi:hypothetical protein
MTKIKLALLGAVVLFAACRDSTGVNSVDSLPTSALAAGITTPQVLQNLATGVMAQDRATIAQSYLVWADVIARDVLRLDQSESRYTSEFFINPPDGSGFLGGAQWTNQYVTARAANGVIIGLKNSPATVADAGQKSAATGFLRTIKAMEYLRIAELRDSLGIVIQGDDPKTVDPIRCKTAALAAISALLDSAYADLQAGTTLPFELPSGWASNGDYSTVANLIKFNRGLKGKVENLRGFDRSAGGGAAAAFQNALTALNLALAGMAPTAAGLAQGPYYQYNPNPPESFGNPLTDSKLHLNNLFVTGAQVGDQRVATHVVTRSTAATAQGYTANYDLDAFVNTPSNLTRLVPILFNADLLIERAKAEIELNQLAQAATDLNIIRVVLGGLPPYAAFATQAEARLALLYEQRYTLIGTGPQRFVTLRGYDLLKTLPPMSATDPYPQAWPIPQVEVNARNNNITCS